MRWPDRHAMRCTRGIGSSPHASRHHSAPATAAAAASVRRTYTPLLRGTDLFQVHRRGLLDCTQTVVDRLERSPHRVLLLAQEVVDPLLLDEDLISPFLQFRIYLYIKPY